MTLEILTPEKKFFSGDADSVLMPGTDGKFEILKGHAPLISSLRAGEIRIRKAGKDTIVKVKSGFVEVLGDKVNVMVEGVE